MPTSFNSRQDWTDGNSIVPVERREILTVPGLFWFLVAMSVLGGAFVFYGAWFHFGTLGEPRVVEKIVERPAYAPPPATPAPPQEVHHSGAVDLNVRTPPTLSCEASCRAKYTGDFAEACIDGYCPRQ